MPRDAQAFALRLDERRALLDATATRVIATLHGILEARRAARTALDGLRGEVFAPAVAEMNLQLGALLDAGFPTTPEQPWFNQLPRYLKGIARRAIRMSTNLERDTALAARIRPFEAQYQSLSERGVPLAAAPALRQLRWMLEEFRISLHAQELRTL